MRADGKRLRQVLLNLLNNAVKFTVEGRVGLRVTVLEADASQVRLRFEVSDTGIGIAADQLKRLFRPFEQAGGVQRRFGGAGLGLAICRQLVGLMGCDIQVESREGEGSRFTFDIALPLAVQGQPATATGAEDITGYEGPRRRVLVVDDLAGNRVPLVQVLGQLGFEVIEAANGAEALDRISAHRPDLVLMDSVMPVMDGAEATRRLRRDARWSHLPVITVSANASEADRADSLAAGADGFIAKPVDFSRLLAEMARLLQLAWTRRAADDGARAAPGRLVLPPPDEMAELVQLARIGNMRSIRDRALRLGAEDERFRPLAQRLCELAENFESAAITQLLAGLQQGARNTETERPVLRS